MSQAYDDTVRAIADARAAGGPWGSKANGSDKDKWPAWVQLVMAVAAVIVSVTLAYSALDKRISLIEQKLDYIAARIGQKP